MPGYYKSNDIREAIARKIENLPTEELREHYEQTFGPIDLEIDMETGRIYFEEHDVRWTLEDEGWMARSGDTPIHHTGAYTSPTGDERALAAERARKLAQGEGDTLPEVTAPEAAEPMDLEIVGMSGVDDDQPFLRRAKPASPPKTNPRTPRGQLLSYIERCNGEEVERLARDVLGVACCKPMSDGRYHVIEGRSRPEKDVMDRRELKREVEKVLSMGEPDLFASLCAQALGRECVHVGNGDFKVGPKSKPKERMIPTPGMPGPGR